MYEAKKQQNLQLLYILASNSANKPSFENSTKSLFAQGSIDVCVCWLIPLHYIYGALGKKPFCRILKRWIIS